MSRQPLWAHQRAMVDWARARLGSYWNAWMGTGKSCAAINVVTEDDAHLILVTCPKSVTSVWVREVGKHGDANCVVLDLGFGTIAKRVERLKRALERQRMQPSQRLFVAINYDSAWRPIISRLISSVQWDVMLVDEAHRSKSPTGRASKYLAKVPAKRKVAFSGTPMPHGPLDIFAQFRVIAPHVFGDNFVRFRARYAIVDTRAGFPAIRGWRNQEEMAALMATVMMTVPRNVLSLPPFIHETRDVVLEPETLRAYRALEEDCVARVNEGTVTPANGLVLLLRLQQLTGGFCSLDPDPIDALLGGGAAVYSRIANEKEDALVDILEDIGTDEAVVCVARFRPDLDAIHRAAERVGRKSGEISGRRKDVHAYWEPTDPNSVLAVQIQAGGVGIDLTRARIMVFFSMGFSNGDYDQVLARIHRPGQVRSVVYYHLIAKDTVDHATYGAMRKKAKVVDYVLATMDRRTAAQAVGQ